MKKDSKGKIKDGHLKPYLIKKNEYRNFRNNRNVYRIDIACNTVR